MSLARKYQQTPTECNDASAQQRLDFSAIRSSSIKALGGRGILTRADLPQLSSTMARIAELLWDGKPHPRDEIARIVPENSDFTRRIRDLKRWLRENCGHDIVTTRSEAGPRHFDYQLVFGGWDGK